MYQSVPSSSAIVKVKSSVCKAISTLQQTFQHLMTLLIPMEHCGNSAHHPFLRIQHSQTSPPLLDQHEDTYMVVMCQPCFMECQCCASST
jgi:hypothetical protein